MVRAAVFALHLCRCVIPTTAAVLHKAKCQAWLCACPGMNPAVALKTYLMHSAIFCCHLCPPKQLFLKGV